LSEKVDFEFLKKHLWGAADDLRGSLDPSEYRQPIMTVLFLKRLNDVFVENAEKFKKEGKTQKEAYEQDFRHHAVGWFWIPPDARWEKLTGAKSNFGAKLNEICKLIEEKNEPLRGVLTITKYNDKSKYPDTSLRDLIFRFDKPSIGNQNLVGEDIFGDAYEYLLAEFANETKKKGGEFFTPRQVVKLLVKLTCPKPDMKICDPTVGSGGMLILSYKHLPKEKAKTLTLHGQESNRGNMAMCKMNLVLHGITGFRIEHGKTLEEPKLTKGGQLLKYDRVLANFPFSMDWKNGSAAKDKYKRYEYGIPPAKDKADFAFIQHMLTSLNEKGQAAIICSQGILFRSGEEGKIRKNMILGDVKKDLQGDVIEGIIALPSKLFFGTGIPGCILILNKNKPKERKNKIIFIYAAKEFKELKNRNDLEDAHVDHIIKKFKEFKDEDRYSHVADLKELEENEYNLNVPRYVDISEPEKPIDIQKTINELQKLEKESKEIEKKVNADLKELGFKI
jgi:type I restriction enzyme M protein